MASDSGSGVGPDVTVAVPLAEGFDHELEEWEKATAAVLRKTKKLGDDDPDSDVWAHLSTATLDGIDVPPLGTADLVSGLPDTGLPGQAPFTRGSVAGRELDGWDNRAWHTDPDVERTAQHVVTDIENGVNSLWISVGEGAVPTDALARILEPVFLDLAPVVLDAPDDPLTAARTLDAVLQDKATDAAPGTSFGADPIGIRVRRATGGAVGTDDLSVAVEVARLAQDRGVRGIVVDGTAVHDAGASDVQELAYVLLAGAAYLRLLTREGFTPDQAAEQLDVRLAATDEQFPTIAKLRAARRLWSRMLELSGVGEAQRAQRQHVVTSRPMMASYDPYANMLRTTIAAFAAGVGGATSVTVLPFDEPLGLPEPFSRRIARNTSSLLISESHVARVLDPAGGSHAVEKLTDDTARAAWALFTDLDGAGDLDASLAALHERVKATVSDRALAIARRARPLTGVSEFPNLHEEIPERRPYGRHLPVLRYGQEFEQMRDEPAAEPVFLATMGTIAQHTARATFAANLFAAGGIDTVTAGPSEGPEDVVTAYREADTPAVVCLTGPDPLYAAWGTDLVAALREAGARRVVVAGKPGTVEEGAVDASAVDDWAAAGLDALAFLRRTREELGR
ncbi:methylmalonyl-CoA mutase family protein [Aeromicrobium sp. CTD01-1L150]|uniref:methylmalonyl-CoA mutase family protein n=1 Tax=Aeromicrobium sp. CTD01-1L150 TaxID=3341830 RepID=UPI0035C18850